MSNMGLIKGNTHVCVRYVLRKILGQFVTLRAAKFQKEPAVSLLLSKIPFLYVDR